LGVRRLARLRLPLVLLDRINQVLVMVQVVVNRVHIMGIVERGLRLGLGIQRVLVGAVLVLERGGRGLSGDCVKG
jgi:hypothetical protein